MLLGSLPWFGSVSPLDFARDEAVGAVVHVGAVV
jgi:hypothetical protein